jgi:hypothetical protein
MPEVESHQLFYYSTVQYNTQSVGMPVTADRDCVPGSTVVLRSTRFMANALTTR